MNEAKIEFLALSIPAKLFTTPTLPSGKDIVTAINERAALRESHDALLEAAKQSKSAMFPALTRIPHGDKIPRVITNLEAAISATMAAIEQAEKLRV